MHCTVASLSAGLFGCQAPDQSASESAALPNRVTHGAHPTPPPSPPSVTSLTGEWRVAAIDDVPFNEPYGLALKGDAELLWWEPRCAGMARRYRIDGGSIKFSLAGVPQAAGSPPPPVCAMGLPARLREVARALDAATSVSRTTSDGILITGAGHNVTLFAQ